ncbi:MAG: hypothetical protein E7252_04065 [Lachnospira sp.]|nr:hypothetical protein [Lachnospira sp.]
MSRCYYLDYISNSYWGTSSDKYICKLCGKEFYADDPQIKYTCNSTYSDEYQKCPVYKDRR